jgi:hypothetical protein
MILGIPSIATLGMATWAKLRGIKHVGCATGVVIHQGHRSVIVLRESTALL